MPEGIGLHVFLKLADKRAFRVVDPLGDADYQIGHGFQRRPHRLDKFIRIKGSFRQIDKDRIVSLKFSGKGGCGGQPSGVTSHDLNDSDRFFAVIYRGVQSDLAHRGGDVFCRASESRCVVREYQVVVDGLGDPDETDLAADLIGVCRQLAHGVHGVVSADVEKETDMILFKSLKDAGIYFVLKVIRETVSAGTQVGARRCADQFQFPGSLKRFHIHDSSLEQSLDPVDHPIDRAAGILPVQGFTDNPVETGIDDGGGAAGLSDDYIFLHSFPP